VRTTRIQYAGGMRPLRYWMVRPQRPQNLVPGGYVAEQLPQTTSTGRGAFHEIAAPPIEAPQRPQNFVPNGCSALQRVQRFGPAAGAKFGWLRLE